VSLAMAVAVGAIALAAPGGTAGARRTSVAAALGLATAAGALVQIVAGSPAGSGPSESFRVAAVIAVVALAAPVWLVIRAALERRTRDRSPREGSTLGGRARPVWIAVAVIALSVLAGSLAFGASAGRGAGAAAGFLHGRDSTWGAAIETFADRPLRGAGADAFLAASARHQGGQTIAFAHDLPLELGAELGVGGLLLALGLYAATARSLWRARGSPAVWLLGPAAAAFLVASLVDWPWHLAGAGAVWALAAGALAGAPTSGPKTSQ
jgi:O-antigen ligase